MTVYEIPIVSANLHDKEMIAQISDCLDYLDLVSKEIFTQVAVKIQASRMRIKNIKVISF